MRRMRMRDRGQTFLNQETALECRTGGSPCPPSSICATTKMADTVVCPYDHQHGIISESSRANEASVPADPPRIEIRGYANETPPGLRTNGSLADTPRVQSRRDFVGVARHFNARRAEYPHNPVP